MSKSVLIIDTPANCFECPCFMEMGWRCQCRLDIDEDAHDGRPEWCPLKSFPEQINKGEDEYDDYYTIGFEDGWNDCLKKLLEGCEEENERGK